MTELDSIIKEVKKLIENKDALDPDVARRLQLAISIDTHTEVKKINGRLKKVEKAAKTWEDHPTLLWLLRYKTKTTVAVILGILAVFGLLYASGLIPFLFECVGLPPLFP